MTKLKPCRKDDPNPPLALAGPGFACGFLASRTCTPTSILTIITVIARTIPSASPAPHP